jgi:hypothetical protein
MHKYKMRDQHVAYFITFLRAEKATIGPRYFSTELLENTSIVLQNYEPVETEFNS